MAQAQQDDSDYGVPDPNEVLSEQQASYAQEMARAPNASARAVISGISGLQNFGGGGPKMQEAVQVQSAMRNILAQSNSMAQDGEDPLTSQMRTASLMAKGLMSVSPKAALAAQDQLVKLSQARQQQQFLSTKQQEAEETLKQEKFKSTVMQNTPQTIVLAQDQGKDANGLPLGYKEYKSYDATDPASIAQMRADAAAAKANGTEVVPMTMKDLIDGRMQSTIARGQYQNQQAMIAALSRQQVAETKGSGAKDDHMVNRIMTAADMGATQLTNIAGMNFGVSRGLLPSLMGTASLGSGLLEMTKGNLYNTLTSEDQQMYTTMMKNAIRPLAIIEQGGGIQGGAMMASAIEGTLTIRPSDTPLNVLTKLAEARQIIESGSDVYLHAKSTDPDVKAQLQQKIDAMKQGIPWTPADVIAFKKSLESDPQLTFAQFAKQKGIVGAQAPANQIAAGAQATQAPLKRDANGTAYTAQF